MSDDVPRRADGEGERRVGPYVLGPRLGEGGMGVVWRSVDHQGREVSIKVLRPHIAHDEHARARLRREVDTLARVHHPRIASVLDADVDGPAPYIVTEYVPGAPLDAVVAEQGPLGPEALVRLGEGLSEALAAIHGVGIVHRDLKPGNVLMVGDDPVVIDFGIAQVADDSRLTMTGMVMGTPGYLSPEVVEGGSVTEATDWWGWAATLSFAASGKPPFGSGPMSVVLDRVVRGRTKLTGVDEQLRPLLLAALDPDPARRPDSSEVMDAMQAYAAHRPVTEAMTSRSLTSARHVADVAGVSDMDSEDSTRRSPVVNPTRAQPVAHTRVSPQSPPRASAPAGPSAYREPRPYPHTESYPSQRSAGEGPRSAPPDYARPPGQAWPPQPWSPQGQPQGQPYAGSPGPSAGSPGPYSQGATAYPPAQGDPRIGRPMRTGTILTLFAVFVGLCTLAPLLAWLLLGLWSVLTRWIDRSMTGLVMRRHQSGLRRSDIPMTLMAAPLRLIPAVLTSLLWLLLPLGFAVTAAFATTVGMTQGAGIVTSVEDPIPIAVGSALGAVIGWWGPGSVSMRRGTRTLIRAAMPSGLVTQLLLTFFLVASVALGVWAVLDGQSVSWWPNPSGDAPLLDRISPTILGQGFFGN